MSLTVHIRLLDPDIPVPALAHRHDAGYDLYSRVSITLAPGQRALIPTGIALAIPPGYAGFVQPRSGLASNHGISIVNSPGLIDAGYRGEVKVIVINHDPTHTVTIRRKDKICQLVIQKVEEARFIQVDSLEETDRGQGGFGSTGT